MRRILVALAACAVALGASAPAVSAHEHHEHHRHHHHEAAGPADLSLKMTFVGKGTPHGRVGQVSTYKVTVRNLGPGTAHEVRISFGMGDQFNPVSSFCGKGTAESDVVCTFPRLGRHDGVTVRFRAVVCCFPEGEVRDTVLSGSVESLTPDPNPGNNFLQLAFHITGGHGFFPPT